MLPIPPELLRAAGFEVGQQIKLTAQAGHLEAGPVEADPSLDLLEFAARFTGRYRYALEELARSSR